jgi:hypothetical protein
MLSTRDLDSKSTQQLLWQTTTNRTLLSLMVLYTCYCSARQAQPIYQAVVGAVQAELYWQGQHTWTTEGIQVAWTLLPVCTPHALKGQRLGHQLARPAHAARCVQAQDDWAHLSSRADLLQPPQPQQGFGVCAGPTQCW